MIQFCTGAALRNKCTVYNFLEPTAIWSFKIFNQCFLDLTFMLLEIADKQMALKKKRLDWLF